MNKEYFVRTIGVNYSYSKKENVLQDINIEVERGTIYGFLGPNGSGKTTTLSLLLGLLRKQKGKIEIFGQELSYNHKKILQRTGSLIESPSLYGHLSAYENLEVHRVVHGASKERILEVLKMVNLENTQDKAVKNFSLGMKQRLSIAVALLPNPELLILDEPANGLDPAGMVELRKLLKKLNEEQNMTIVVSSHILSEVEKLVTHVGILYKGRMLFQGKLEDLQKLQRKQLQLSIITANNKAAIKILQGYDLEEYQDEILVLLHSRAQIPKINKLLVQNNIDVFHLNTHKKNLEQLFIDLTSSTYEYV